MQLSIMSAAPIEDEEQKSCSACCVPKNKTAFSGSQWRQRTRRRCTTCVGVNRDIVCIDPPATARDEPQTTPASPDADCSICLETLLDPVTLPCGHSNCKKCLASMKTLSAIDTCPSCREPLPPGAAQLCEEVMVMDAQRRHKLEIIELLKKGEMPGGRSRISSLCTVSAQRDSGKKIQKLFKTLPRPEDIVSKARAAVDLDPSLAHAHFVLGEIRRRVMGEDPKSATEAIACYRKCLSIHPNHVSALSHLGFVTEDIVLGSRAVALAPDNADAQMMLAHSLSCQVIAAERVGNFHGAKVLMEKEAKCYRRCLVVEPDNEHALKGYARFLRNEGDVAGAMAILPVPWREELMKECMTADFMAGMRLRHAWRARA